jgi:pimeloyl-ACP methyl ester carboxylesterase
MATFVLVHGAWHGGWCWQRVSRLLRAAGHAVFAPTLTGLGERVHLAHAGVGLETHIQDIVNVLEYEDLHQVVLVGHSYGGMVITGVAEQAAEQLAHLVYLDAFLPDDGQCLLDLLPEALVRQLRQQVTETGDGWRLRPAPGNFGVTVAADQAWLQAKVVDQPFATFEQPVRCRNAAASALPRTYILCTSPASFAWAAEPVRADSRWRYRELHTGHDAMVTEPEELTRLLLEVCPVDGEALRSSTS